MSDGVESSPTRTKEQLISLIGPEFEKFHKLHKEYKFSRIRFERIYRKLGRHNVYFLEKIWVFTQDLNLIHNKIEGILKAPLARTPDFWTNYSIMFPGGTDRERLPEHDMLEQLYARFRALMGAFLSTNKVYYARKKPPVDPSESRIQS